MLIQISCLMVNKYMWPAVVFLAALVIVAAAINSFSSFEVDSDVIVVDVATYIVLDNFS